MRVCTTVAIAIVAETCSPFTVIPALMNEYRVPELNVQHGVLKALSFMCEYIGEMCKDYVYALTPLLVDALMERYALRIMCNVLVMCSNSWFVYCSLFTTKQRFHLLCEYSYNVQCTYDCQLL